jgi:aspartokinase
MMSLSATGINLTVIVDSEQLNPALERLHTAFFGGATK